MAHKGDQPRTLLLAVEKNFTVKIGLPPMNPRDDFNGRAAVLGKINNVSHIACSPDGELFCICGGDLYRGPMPSNIDVDWFSVAQRVGKAVWNRIVLMFFHPKGDFYVTTNDGEFYKGPPPDNEHVPWIYDQAKRIGHGIWKQYEALFFSPEGLLYAVGNDKLFKAPPPTEESVQWDSSCTCIGGSDWSRLTHFLSFSPDGKLWAVDKWNGHIFRGNPPTQEDPNYQAQAQDLGSNYNVYRFLAFTKDATIQKIMNFQFLVDQAQILSQAPEVLQEKIYDNRKSSSTLRHTFTFNKTIKESSSFSHEHGFTFQAGTEMSFEGGIPVIAEISGKVTVNMSTTHKWNFTKTNETQISFSSSTNIELEPHKAIRMVASVIKGEINVPYKAKARTLFGAEVEVQGMWRGVSHYHLIVTQEDYNK
ncbi:tachylectin-2-like isoform X1 [Hyla sarda]|uniref:tachylectin-2-like isoform X1 n=2 Tax=Hyla sarda TaxID=327740 RepID=UPI0024C398C7|nr:tachylectin-2-like isoform X1 [Hyla sarda]XP_056400138.1 tachylectin-2-like isoform X1 [Hyla sarda]XP_056400232.1 tachylectin-2-like isoform X1 [Hyla sarda]XP_056400303.1 tachylectin-2-like isoform X1 [Hyla sarda]XP_056400385.1 tachylectin-2-like isoform X1 [Hyla sarda]XP_056400463.1 tachylectin-2-like isoform X1 [Hyla sarda]XP_056400548.1 tachylectin-2-like isoform X1 [Hyla sarda]XP_056400634.1 tachylectin-2-like isoform X1 [Hyla sarda]XP_056400724.1 tachylectin-2-like isoform X1 [Hyla 